MCLFGVCNVRRQSAVFGDYGFEGKRRERETDGESVALCTRRGLRSECSLTGDRGAVRRPRENTHLSAGGGSGKAVISGSSRGRSQALLSLLLLLQTEDEVLCSVDSSPAGRAHSGHLERRRSASATTIAPRRSPSMA